MEPAAKGVVRDSRANGGGESRRVSDGSAVGFDGVRAGFLGRKQADLGEHSGPNQAGVADKFEHDELGEDAPSLTAPPLDQLVDDRDREHDDHHAGGEAGQQGVPGPEASCHDVGDDSAGQGEESDNCEHPRAAEKDVDRR